MRAELPRELLPDDLQRIRASEGWRRDRVEVLETSAGPVVVKGQRPPRSVTPRRMFNWAMQAAGLATLKVPLRDGGPEAQQVEVRRLAELRAAGVRVPTLMHVEPGFFVQEYLTGPDLSRELSRGAGDRLAVWQQGVAAVQAVHSRQECLSQAFARNFIVTPEGIAAIDHEEDPLEVVSLPQAQARDWLFYLHSTLWLLPERRAEMLSVWERVVGAESRLVADFMHRLARRLAPLRHLPSQRKPWGRDIVSAQAAASFLNTWSRS
ncbi:hypothetical protein RD110_18465 [Rhodoferax koreense]|uniref:Serine/threonine protein phosphatase n=1 Tax=Rhodoferax koreensis TaxID=1842727 RepID=A0A1P8JYW8_9BURK|nr:hypothetical protein [Rhodoferax koreense]APW38943.1 hypothetical protein RD110_18465 [Rhodoferax koreense]